MLPRSSRRYETYRETDSLRRRLRRIVGVLLLFFLVYEAVTTVLLSSVEQESIAMEPTISEGDRLFALPLVYGPRIRLFGWVLPGIRPPVRGDIVAVRPPYMPRPGWAGRLADPIVRFVTLGNRRVGEGRTWESSVQVKRIVGVPGDTIQIERFVAYVQPSGEREFVSEFALTSAEYQLQIDERPAGWEALDPFGAAAEAVTLADGEYFVLTDNRSAGLDSRHWGVVTHEHIIAKLSYRFRPLSRFGRP
ncbi:MAG: signal peptidase I [Spirochaetota bacterium]